MHHYQSSTTLPSVFSTFFLETSLPLAAACSEMEFDPCRSEAYLGITHYFLIYSAILAVCKLQAVLTNLVMTSNYTASVLFEEGKVQSEYGLIVKCIYVKETFIEVLRGKKKIC